MFTHFVWLLNNRHGYDAQLWSQDFTTGQAPGGNYRRDMPFRIGERVALKVKLEGADRDILLDVAKLKWPAPVVKH